MVWISSSAENLTLRLLPLLVTEPRLLLFDLLSSQMVVCECVCVLTTIYIYVLSECVCACVFMSASTCGCGWVGGLRGCTTQQKSHCKDTGSRWQHRQPSQNRTATDSTHLNSGDGVAAVVFLFGFQDQDDNAAQRLFCVCFFCTNIEFLLSAWIKIEWSFESLFAWCLRLVHQQHPQYIYIYIYSL